MFYRVRAVVHLDTEDIHEEHDFDNHALAQECFSNYSEKYDAFSVWLYSVSSSGEQKILRMMYV